MHKPVVIRKLADTDIEGTKALLRAYFRWIDVDLSFQDVDSELANFPGVYVEPDGAFLVADAGGEIVGCVGLKRLEDGICEMKRLYVRDDCKGIGLGRHLVERIIGEAKSKGYARMRLDSLRRMERAVALYHRFGFYEIGQYVENPVPDAVFMEKVLNVPGLPVG